MNVSLVFGWDVYTKCRTGAVSVQEGGRVFLAANGPLLPDRTGKNPHKQLNHKGGHYARFWEGALNRLVFYPLIGNYCN